MLRLGRVGPAAGWVGGGLGGQNCEGTCRKGEEKGMRKLSAMLRTQHADFWKRERIQRAEIAF